MIRLYPHVPNSDGRRLPLGVTVNGSFNGVNGPSNGVNGMTGDNVVSPFPGDDISSVIGVTTVGSIGDIGPSIGDIGATDGNGVTSFPRGGISSVIGVVTVGAIGDIGVSTVVAVTP